MEQGFKILTVIEGGGSTCRGLTYDLMQNRASTPLILDNHPCNLSRDRDLTLQSLRTMIGKLGATQTKLTPKLILCLPGISHVENASWLKTRLQTDGHDTVHLASDAIAALLGAFETLQDGQGIFIGGTGSMALGYNNGQFWRIGTPESEKACGPWIARKACEAGKHDPELKRIFAPEEDPIHAPHHVIAAYTPAIFEAARQGNQVAEAILQEAAASAVDHMTQLHDFGVRDFVLCGSVARALQTRIAINTSTALGTGLDGALKLALFVHKNPETLSLFTNLRRIEDDEPEQRISRP